MPRLVLPIALIAALMTALLVLPAAGSAADQSSAAAPVAATAGQIDAYLVAKGSPMAGQGAAFIASGGRWQVDPRLLVAIAGAESSFGQITCAPFNAWGYGCPNGPYSFTSWADGIDTVAQGLRTNYLAEGRTTVALINLKYAPIGAANDPTGLNNHWTQNVSRFLIELGGDPNDLDMDGIAGTIMLGPLGGPVDEFGFEEQGDASSAAALKIAAGDPKPLVVAVKNTGMTTWSPRDVRLRRLDTESRVVGAPYGALDATTPVGPGETGRFVVQLAVVGVRSGEAHTSWRLEGPAGPFGGTIERTIRFAVPQFVGGDATSSVDATNAGIAGGEAFNVFVKVRNTGAETWMREGDQAVYLGLVDAAGQPLQPQGWVNERVASRMLEREAAPGEIATFAFRVGGSGGVLAMRPLRAGAWARGGAALVQVGSVAPAIVEQLRARIEADAAAAS